MATASSNTIFRVQFYLADFSCSDATLYFVKGLSLLTTWEGGWASLKKYLESFNCGGSMINHGPVNSKRHWKASINF